MSAIDQFAGKSEEGFTVYDKEKLFIELSKKIKELETKIASLEGRTTTLEAI